MDKRPEGWYNFYIRSYIQREGCYHVGSKGISQQVAAQKAPGGAEKGEAGPQYRHGRAVKKYLESIENLDKELERLSAPEKGTGVPKALTKDEAGKLAELMRKTAVDGEEYLAYNTLEDGKVKPGMPQVVDKLQSLMAKDHQTLVDYNEEEPKTLPELQETSRTLTIDLRGKKLSTVGNMQNSRIPMTVLDSTGRKRKGFFTKANYFRRRRFSKDHRQCQGSLRHRRAEGGAG